MQRAAILVSITVLLFFGCMRSAPEIADYDSNLARETLITALDAWKAGKVKSLADRQPPLRFVDDDYSAGFKLTGYELIEPLLKVRPHQGVQVRLTLRSRTGTASTRVASYQISFTPGPAVLRSDP